MNEKVMCQWWANHPQERSWLLRDKYRWTAGQIDRSTFETLPVEVLADVERLSVGEPLAYVIGWVPFLDFRIDLSFKTLIPRPETEYWVGKLLQEWSGEPPSRVLDLCCGSGCIGLAVARKWASARVVAVDIDEAALQQTRRNAARLAVQNVEVEESDLFQQLKGWKFDLIVTNPPYVDPEEKPAPELKFEPSVALYAGEHGFEIVRRILGEAGEHLSAGGQLWMETGETQQQLVTEAAVQVGWKIDPLIDQFGKFRGIVGRRM